MSKPNALALGCRHHLIVLYQINWICPMRSLCLTTVCYIKRLLIPLIWYYNVSLVKTRLRASRRGEVPSLVGVRQPNSLRKCLHIFRICHISNSRYYRFSSAATSRRHFFNVPHCTFFLPCGVTENV